MDKIAMITLADTGTLTICTGVIIFLAITLLLVTVLLIAKKFLVHTGQVDIKINNDKDVFAMSGKPSSLPSPTRMCSCRRLVAARAAADSARYRYSKGAATSSPPRPCISPASR